MPDAITTEGLAMSFGGLRAVDGLTLSVPAGVVFGFLGPNGAGKTTTIRLLLGLLRPTSGRASVAGFDSWERGGDVRAHCGVLLDEPGLYDRLTAEENLEFYGRVWGIALAGRRERIRELLDHERAATEAGLDNAFVLLVLGTAVLVLVNAGLLAVSSRLFRRPKLIRP